MKRVLLFLVLFYGLACAQPVFHSPLMSEINIVPDDSSAYVYYSYRIPLKTFVFVKDGNNYSANYRITVEVSDSLTNKITRQIEEKKIVANNFDETNSNNSFEEGMFLFRLKPGRYDFLPIIYDLNSKKELKTNLLVRKIKKNGTEAFLPPIVINKTDKIPESYQLTNFAGDIPFSEQEYDLLVPCIDTSIKSINASIINNSDTVVDKNISKSFTSGILMKMSDDGILIERSNRIKPAKYFILSGFSRKLYEGPVKIEVSSAEINEQKKEYEKKVVWFDKPFSLRNPETAIKYLEIIEKKDTISKLLRESSKKYESALIAYWKKLDPTPNSEFNPIMEEYYRRIDYSFNHFYTISRHRDLLTDRSKIYVKYGNPTEIKRSYNKYGKSVETWIYKKPPRVFSFIDVEGTGNFILLNGNE